MKNKFLFMLLFLSAASWSQVPHFGWARQLDDSNGSVFITSTAADGEGNLYLAGVFTGTVDIDPGPAADSLTEAGFGDIFIAKMDPSGNLLWAKQAGGSSYDEASAIATDAAGNIYVTGFFNLDSIDFDPGPGTFLMSAGESSFVLKLDKNGNFAWAKQLESIAENYATSIALDAENNILVTGQYAGTADFDPNAGTYNLSTAAIGMYTWKLDHNGALVWARQVETLSSSTRIYSIATDAAGNVFTCGLLKGTTDFDPGPGVYNLDHSSTAPCAFVLKLNAAGDFAWAKKMEGSDIGLHNGSILTGPGGCLYFGGSFSGTVDFDPGAGVQPLIAAAGNNHFLLRLDSSATFSWVKQLDGMEAMALDHQGNIYTCSSGIHRFDADGTAMWTVSMPLCTSITVDAHGGVYTTGTFTGTVDFDPGAGMYNLTGTGTNPFIHKMEQPSPTGTGELSRQNVFTIYPNPCAGYFYLQADIPGDYTLMNSMGQVISTVSVKDHEPTLVETELLPHGLYLMSGNGTLSKVVIQH